MTLLKAQHIQKNYEGALGVLKDINFTLEKGESLAIMGRSGEGKSTLLSLLGTLEKPSSGTLTFLGKPLESYSETEFRNKHLGFIFQAFNLLEDLNVLENILLPQSIQRKNTKKGSPAYCQALILLEKVGLLEKKTHLAKVLSGGEKQRVAIARALINNPSLILADEPSGNIDAAGAALIHQLLLDLPKDGDKGLIVVTHDEMLAKKCDRILQLKEGILIEIPF